MFGAVLGVIADAQGGSGSAGAAGGSAGSASDFDPTAWIALTLSIVGILVTVFLRYLDGPRAKVSVRPVLFNVGLFNGHITYHGGQWPIPTMSQGAALKQPDPGEVIELAEIVIENAGRNPMTVYEIGFRWLGRRKKDRWWRRRVRHTSVPTPIRPPNQESERVYAEGDQFRIEPSDVVTLLVNYWDLVRSHRPSPKGVIELRAAARVAGRSRLKLSSRKRRWRIPDSGVTSIGMREKVPLRAVISKSIALSLLYTKAKTLGDVYYLSRSLESALEGFWSDDWKENHERLRGFQKNSSVHFMLYDDDTLNSASLMFNVHRAIDEYKDVIDWSDIAQSGLHKMFSGQASTAAEVSNAAAVESGELTGSSDGFGEALSRTDEESGLSSGTSECRT